jgi:hypothetical protein
MRCKNSYINTQIRQVVWRVVASCIIQNVIAGYSLFCIYMTVQHFNRIFFGVRAAKTFATTGSLPTTDHDDHHVHKFRLQSFLTKNRCLHRNHEGHCRHCRLLCCCRFGTDNPSQPGLPFMPGLRCWQGCDCPNCFSYPSRPRSTGLRNRSIGWTQWFH